VVIWHQGGVVAARKYHYLISLEHSIKKVSNSLSQISISTILNEENFERLSLL